MEFLGVIDILINNAGITFNKPFLEVEPRQFDRLFNVNLRSPFFLTQSLAGELQKSDGAVVINISSIHAYFGMRDHTVYAATKGAIVSYTRVLAIELAALKIGVNTIAPGAIQVEKREKALSDTSRYETMGASFPSGFVGVPEDIGDLALFLASPESRYIVGQTFLIDGGMSAIMPVVGTQESSKVQFGMNYLG